MAEVCGPIKIIADTSTVYKKNKPGTLRRVVQKKNFFIIVYLCMNAVTIVPTVYMAVSGRKSLFCRVVTASKAL